MQPQAKWLASLLQLTQGAVGSIFNCTQRPVKGVCLINSFLVSQKNKKNKKQEEKAQCHNAVGGRGDYRWCRTLKKSFKNCFYKPESKHTSTQIAPHCLHSVKINSQPVNLHSA